MNKAKRALKELNNNANLIENLKQICRRKKNYL